MAGKTKVPRIIAAIESAARDDVGPAARLVGEVLFEHWLRPTPRRAPEPVVVVRRREESGPPRLPPVRLRKDQLQIVEVGRRPGAQYAASMPREEIRDAEIVPSCEVCGDTRKVGRRGYQIPCPECCK